LGCFSHKSLDFTGPGTHWLAGAAAKGMIFLK